MYIFYKCARSIAEFSGPCFGVFVKPTWTCGEKKNLIGRADQMLLLLSQ